MECSVAGAGTLFARQWCSLFWLLPGANRSRRAFVSRILRVASDVHPATEVHLAAAEFATVHTSPADQDNNSNRCSTADDATPASSLTSADCFTSGNISTTGLTITADDTSTAESVFESGDTAEAGHTSTAGYTSEASDDNNAASATGHASATRNASTAGNTSTGPSASAGLSAHGQPSWHAESDGTRQTRGDSSPAPQDSDNRPACGNAVLGAPGLGVACENAEGRGNHSCCWRHLRWPPRI